MITTLIDSQPVDQASHLPRSNICRPRCTWSSPPAKIPSPAAGPPACARPVDRIARRRLAFHARRSRRVSQPNDGIESLRGRCRRTGKPAPKVGSLACNWPRSPCRDWKTSPALSKSFTGSHRFVLDYLIEEVLGQQSEKIQTFLLRTSILDRMCGSLCDAVLLDPSASGQEILEQLEHANLFIVPLDNERRWYRYHHFFGDLLRQRLGQPQELSEYHLRASAWYEVNDDLAEAFHHALAAGDFERAARLAEAAWQSMERSFQTLAWLGWVKKLPDAAICSRPWLCVQVGWAYSDVGELEPSETYLQNAERALAGMDGSGGVQVHAGTIALIRAGNAQIEGDLAETVRYAELSVQLAPENDLLNPRPGRHHTGVYPLGDWGCGSIAPSHANLGGRHAKIGQSNVCDCQRLCCGGYASDIGSSGRSRKRLCKKRFNRLERVGKEAKVVTAHHHLGLAMLAHERGDDAAVAQRLQIGR